MTKMYNKEELKEILKQFGIPISKVAYVWREGIFTRIQFKSWRGFEVEWDRLNRTKWLFHRDLNPNISSKRPEILIRNE